MDTKVHETEFCIFWTIQNFVSDKRCFLCIARICTQFDHLESTHDFKSSAHKALNNNKTFDLRFAFLISIKTELDLDEGQHYSAQGTVVHILDVGRENFDICG